MVCQLSRAQRVSRQQFAVVRRREWFVRQVLTRVTLCASTYNRPVINNDILEPALRLLLSCLISRAHALWTISAGITLCYSDELETLETSSSITSSNSGCITSAFRVESLHDSIGTLYGRLIKMNGEYILYSYNWWPWKSISHLPPTGENSWQLTCQSGARNSRPLISTEDKQGQSARRIN